MSAVIGLRRAAPTAAAILILTNGPVFLFAKSVLDRPGHWEDHAVWPFFAAAAVGGAALVATGRGRGLGRPLEPAQRAAAAAIAWYSLVALVSSVWSVHPFETAWRAAVYVGLSLLAWVVAGLDDEDLAGMLGLVTAAAVAGSLALVVLRPDLALGDGDHWKGIYTNRNSLAPLAALGLLAGVRFAAAGTGRSRAAGGALAAASGAALVGAGSRTAWFALLVAVAAATLPMACLEVRRRWGPAPAGAVGAIAAAAGLGALAVQISALWDVATFSQRRTIWRLVWDLILERPLVGHGFFTFWDIPELTQHALLRRGSAHGSLLEVGLGLGVLGTLPFVVIVVLAARNAATGLWRRPGADAWMWAAIVAFLLVENVTESFVLWFSYNWVLLMAAALRSPGPRPDRHGAERVGAGP